MRGGGDKESVKIDVPNLSWLVGLSDGEFKRVKQRYADFVAFSFREVLKMVVRAEVYKLDEFAEALSTEVIREMLRDKSLSRGLRKALREELKAKESRAS